MIGKCETNCATSLEDIILSGATSVDVGRAVVSLKIAYVAYGTHVVVDTKNMWFVC
jgi:hypothetical protein